LHSIDTDHREVPTDVDEVQLHLLLQERGREILSRARPVRAFARLPFALWSAVLHMPTSRGIV